MTTKDHRLIGLLQRAVYLQQQQWTVMGLLESYITNNNGLTGAQTQASYEAVRVLASAGDRDTLGQAEGEYYLQEVARTGTIVRKPDTLIPPMPFDEFSVKYAQARKDGGDAVGDLTLAYAIYCQNPAGHFLHKEIKT